ncbi:MAG TPA: serine kinase [Firmicutes bacterium]|nr:serine kinase [Bacillota bacterium]
MKVSELTKKANLNLINELYDREIEGVYISDMVSDIVAGAKANSLLITIQTHKNLLATANLVDVAAIVYVRGKKPMEDVIELADRAKISLFVSDLDSWALAVKLNGLGLS